MTDNGREQISPGRGRIVLCKGQINRDSKVEDAYVRVMRSANFSCDVLSTLRFEFINLEELQAYLSAPQSCAGLILTSPRTVEAIGRVSRRERVVDSLEHWKSLPAYCVGPATESLARGYLGLRNCLGAESGSAEKLAEQIVRDNARRGAKPLLYPCSEIARDTLPRILATDGIKVQKLFVYRTSASETLEGDLSKIIKPPPEIFVFFSPSAVEHVTTLLKERTDVLDDAKVVAVGPVTGRALTEAGIKVDATLDKPEPTALLRAVEEAD